MPDFFRQPEHGPALGPAHIHRGMGNNGRNFCFGHAVGFGVLQVVSQRSIRDAGGHQGNDRDDTLCFDINGILIPHFPEQHVVVEMGKHGREFTQLLPARSLYDLFFHIVILLFQMMRSTRRPVARENSIT